MTLTKPRHRPLGQRLLSAGAISPEELSAALEEQRRTGERIGEALVRRGADAETVAATLAAALRLEYAAPPLLPEAAAAELVDGALAAKLRAVPLAVLGGRLRVAMTDPLDASAIDALRFRSGRRVEPLVASASALDAALALYDPGAVHDILDRLPASAKPSPREDDEVGALRRASQAPPIIALVQHILSAAVKRRASDVHIEPNGDGLRVRARIDGVLRDLLVLPPHAAGPVVSRIKVLAGLDIAVRRRPQDGRAAFSAEGRDLDLRISTLPCHGGEKVVLRILDAADAGQALDSLGLDGFLLQRVRRLLGRTHGVLLVTGPTGSGKTTTLYAALASLDRERRHVLTLEDPVEYRLPGLTQVQVQRRAGLGFAAGLRAVLRQDPDVIMVGEMRDRETVETAMAAALTGHLVLSTLHTNDAPSATTRLSEMGTPPYLVAAALIGVIAQRLARRLCPHCRRRDTASATELRDLGVRPREVAVYRASGCDRCDGVGYRGRTGLFEVLAVDTRVRALLLRRGGAHAVREAARRAGMRTLAQDAWRKVVAGATTLEEVQPLLALLADENAACPRCAEPVRLAFLHCPACAHALRRRCACGLPLEHGWRACPRCGCPDPPR